MASPWCSCNSPDLSRLSPHLFPPLDKIADEAQAKEFLSEYNSTAEEVWNAYTEASWAYNTNITDHNKEIMVWERPWGCAGRAGGTQGTFHRTLNARAASTPCKGKTFSPFSLKILIIHEVPTKGKVSVMGCQVVFLAVACVFSLK